MAKRGKILVVEDDFMNKVLVREILSIHGYEVVEADTGMESITKIDAEMPDVILMDLHLPEMDGISTMKTIKSKSKTNAIPIIAITASAMKGDEEKILMEGFDGYVPKPIEMKRLLFEIEKWLNAFEKEEIKPA